MLDAIFFLFEPFRRGSTTERHRAVVKGFRIGGVIVFVTTNLTLNSLTALLAVICFTTGRRYVVVGRIPAAITAVCACSKIATRTANTDCAV